VLDRYGDERQGNSWELAEKVGREGWDEVARDERNESESDEEGEQEPQGVAPDGTIRDMSNRKGEE